MLISPETENVTWILGDSAMCRVLLTRGKDVHLVMWPRESNDIAFRIVHVIVRRELWKRKAADLWPVLPPSLIVTDPELVRRIDALERQSDDDSNG